MINNYDNEIIVDFSADEEITENEYAGYIDYVFSTMNKNDAKEAMMDLVGRLAKIANDRRETIEEYDSLLETTYGALIEAMNLLNKDSNK